MSNFICSNEPIIDISGTFGERIIECFLLIFFVILILSIFIPRINYFIFLIINSFENLPFKKNKRIKNVINTYIDYRFGKDTERIIKINKYKKAYFIEVLSIVYEGKEKFLDYRRFFPFNEPNPFFDTELSNKVCDGKNLIELPYFFEFIKDSSFFFEFREFKEFCGQKMLN